MEIEALRVIFPNLTAGALVLVVSYSKVERVSYLYLDGSSEFISTPKLNFPINYYYGRVSINQLH